MLNDAFLGVRSAPTGSRSVFPVRKLRSLSQMPIGVHGKHLNGQVPTTSSVNDDAHEMLNCSPIHRIDMKSDVGLHSSKVWCTRAPGRRIVKKIRTQQCIIAHWS